MSRMRCLRQFLLFIFVLRACMARRKSRYTKFESDGRQESIDNSTAPTVVADPKIVGGSNAPAGKYNFYVQGWGCGATLIWFDIILTAAHCYNFLNVPPQMGVVVGAIRRDKTKGGAQRRFVIEQIPHPNHSSFTDEWDFMIAKLDRPVTKKKLQPIVLNWNRKIPKGNEPLQIFGFGSMKNRRGPWPQYLQTGTIKSLSNKKCGKFWGNLLYSDCMLCAYDSPDGGEGVCHGDSGSPLVWNGMQVGIVSWQNKGKCGKDPAVYSRVSAAYNWIQEQLCWFSASPPNYCFDGNYTQVNKTRVDFQYYEDSYKINWLLRDVSSGQILLSFYYVSTQTPYARIIEYIDLKPNSTYEIFVSDYYGQGMAGGYANFSYILDAFDRIPIVNMEFNFTYNQTISFTTPNF